MKALILFLFLSVNTFDYFFISSTCLYLGMEFTQSIEKQISKELKISLDLDLCELAKSYAKDTISSNVYFKENTEFQEYICFEVVYDTILSPRQIIEKVKNENAFFNSYALHETLMGISNSEKRTIFIFRFYNEY